MISILPNSLSLIEPRREKAMTMNRTPGIYPSSQVLFSLALMKIPSYLPHQHEIIVNAPPFNEH